MLYTMMNISLAFTLMVISANAQSKQDKRPPEAPYYSKDLVPGTEPPTGWTQMVDTVVVNSGQTVFFALDNTFVRNNIKHVWLILKNNTDTGLFNCLTIDSVIGYDSVGETSDSIDEFYSKPVSRDGGKTVEFKARFIPQPEWEVLAIRNSSGAPCSLHSGSIYSNCVPRADWQPIPALTNWGLLILLVLLVISGIIVIRHRRRGVARA